ncbi:MAG: membrane protein insertase YidC [Burkholderiales bacterium]|nr:membrane protein insertase YidC [Burkholderiales bacterium]
MNDTRRAILWGVFSLSLVMLWDGWQKSKGEPSLFSPAPVVATSPATTGAASGTALPAPVATGSVATPQAPAVGAPAAAPAATVVATTDNYKVTFDTRGASVIGLQLLKQQGQGNTDKPMMLFEHSPQRLYQADSGLLPRQAGDAPPPNHQTVMTRVDGPLTLDAGKDELAVTFESPEVGGVVLRKTYVFKRGLYTIDVRHEVINRSAANVAPQLYLQLVRDGNIEETSMLMGPSSFTGPAVFSEQGKFQKIEFADIDKGKAEHEKSADNGWVAMVQHYFASAWLVGDKQTREFRATKIANNLFSVAMVLPLADVAPGASLTHNATLYAGPQEENKLAALAPGLELVKDYGMLTLLAKPLFWLLDKLHGILGNWGWAIVALVVLLKIAFYWLNASAYRSMGKMKAINPRVQEMRERLKDKPQLMQQEMMRMYREEKVNPLGGCLPIVVQMPFFIALYWVLLSSVEMRNAPWIGWISDLSSKDPFYILPIVMTLSTMFQTWLNPTPPDPVQAKMMWIMPLVFSVMFFVFPAGLVLYWVTNTLLSIAQQWFINKQLGVLNK